MFNGAATNLPKYKESTHTIGIPITTADIITHFINLPHSRLCINISMAIGNLESKIKENFHSHDMQLYYHYIYHLY